MKSNDKDINPCPGKGRFHVNVISLAMLVEANLKDINQEEKELVS